MIMFLYKKVDSMLLNNLNLNKRNFNSFPKNIRYLALRTKINAHITFQSKEES